MQNLYGVTLVGRKYSVLYIFSRPYEIMGAARPQWKYSVLYICSRLYKKWAPRAHYEKIVQINFQ